MKRRATYLLSTAGVFMLVLAIYSTSVAKKSDDSTIVVADSNQAKPIALANNLDSSQGASANVDRGIGAITLVIENRMEAQKLRKTALSIRSLQSQEYLLRRMYNQYSKNNDNPVGRNYPDSIKQKIRDLLETDVVQLLMSLNIQPHKIHQFKEKGVNLIEAAEAHVRGVATPLQEILLSDNTVVAQVSKSTDSLEGDGFRSSLSLDVSDQIYGSQSDYAVRQISGKREDGNFVRANNDLVAGDKQSYLLMMSNNYYKQLAFEKYLSSKGGKPDLNSTKNTVLFGVPFVVDGNEIIPVSPSLSGNGDLLKIKAELGKLNSGEIYD